MLGEEAGTVYDRDRLIELIRMNVKANASDEDFTIVTGALEYTKKTVKEVLTPVEVGFWIFSSTTFHQKILVKKFF